LHGNAKLFCSFDAISRQLPAPSLRCIYVFEFIDELFSLVELKEATKMPDEIQDDCS